MNRPGYMKKIVQVSITLLLIWICGCAVFKFRPEPLAVKRVIDRDTQWRGTVVLDKDVLVLPGIKLIIAPGTIVRVKKNTGTKIDPRFLFTGNELMVRGTLLAEGTPDQPILFTSAKAEPEMEDWAGIILDGAGADESVIKHCRIEFAGTGIYCINSSPELSQNQLVKNKYGIICQQGALPYIKQNEISAGEVGIACWDNSAPKIEANQILDNRQAGILWGIGATPWFENNRIEGNRFGIFGGEEYIWTTNQIKHNEHDFYLSP
jgi:hypothetical protein